MGIYESRSVLIIVFFIIKFVINFKKQINMKLLTYLLLSSSLEQTVRAIGYNDPPDILGSYRSLTGECDLEAKFMET